MRRLIVTASAIADMDSIWMYIALEQHRPAAADQLVDDIDAHLQLLLNHPLIGEAVEHLRPGTRRIIVAKRYLLFYEPFEHALLVLRVLHGARLIEKSDLE